VVLVSGGFKRAIEPVAQELGVELHAVGITWTDAGEYTGFDTTSPLARQTGKREVVELLRLGRPSLAVGDGSTDVGMKPVVDDFVAYTGFASGIRTWSRIAHRLVSCSLTSPAAPISDRHSCTSLAGRSRASAAAR
jgi:hypothetical protein